jgi:Asp-tRNA(Asn)/Glu-tRNA(Gln) amidotransferase A subunit family amidase
MTFKNTSPRKLYQLDASEIAKKISNYEISTESLVRSCLERVEEKEGIVKAWTEIDKSKVIRAAKKIDKSSDKNILNGIPIGWKDIIHCKGYKTACGSPIYKESIATINAAPVSMSIRSGALVLGKTVTTEFATSFPGSTTNPHNPLHTPGGSSSGSAAAVADFMVPVAIGTQTGGSVIRPASFCGIVGFKPSFNTISRYGVKQVSDSLDTVGTFSRNVKDTALLVAGLTGRKEFLTASKIKPLKIAICRTANWSQAENAMIDSIYFAGKLLSKNGIIIKEINLENSFKNLDAAHHDIEYFELSRALQDEYLSSPKLLSQAIKFRIETGHNINLSEYHMAIELAQKCKEIAAYKIFSKYDLLLTPSALGEAPKGLSSTGNATFNRIWTLLGLPCISIPSFMGPNQLPLGIQFIGPIRSDVKVLSNALWIEALLKKSI